MPPRGAPIASRVPMSSVKEQAVAEHMAQLLDKAVDREEASHVAFLLKNGATAEERHLSIAVVRKNAAKVQVLLTLAGAVFSETIRQASLILAIRLGSADVVAKLLHRNLGNVNPNFCSDDDDKEYPLHVAIKDTDIIRMLLRHNADANVRNALGELSFCLGFERCHYVRALIHLLFSFFFMVGDTPLHMVENNTAIARLMLDYAGDPAHRNSEGLTALHVACQNNCLDVAKELDGADPNIIDNDGGQSSHSLLFPGLKTLCTLLTLYSTNRYSAPFGMQ